MKCFRRDVLTMRPCHVAELDVGAIEVVSHSLTSRALVNGKDPLLRRALVRRV